MQSDAVHAEDPGKSTAELRTLTEAERNRILYEWNDTRAEYPDVCVHELFERQVARTPDATAVLFQGRQLSYRDLNERANQLGHYLRKRGIGPELLVGVSMERSPEMLIGLLGIWKAGGAYVPMDPTYPKERLSFMVKDSAAQLLLTTNKHKHLFASATDKTILLDSDWPVIAEESTRQSPLGRCALEPGLCDVHLGIDGRAEGSDDSAQRPGELSVLGHPGLFGGRGRIRPCS